MRKISLTMAVMVFAITMDAQPPSGGGSQPGGSSSSSTPDGAAYTLSDGSVVTKSNETLSTSTSDYNVVQVTKGTLNLTSCTVTKSGDTNSTDGDATSFYGINSAVYASGSSAFINMTGGTVTTTSKGSNAIFATDGATITTDGVVIDNSKPVSRGLHCTYGGIINATNVDITTRSETSSTIATDRGGGTVTVTGGTSTAKGNNSAVLYSTGSITATNLTGVSEQGEIAVVEGDNSVTINNCTMTSGSSKRGLMMLQSGSGDADGVNASITVTGGTLNVTGSSTPLCEIPTLNNGTLTLTDVTLSVASGELMLVDYNTQWSTYGGYGHLVLQTTADSWSYTGTVDADKYSHATVLVGKNVVWNGTIDSDNDAVSTQVTVNEGATWVLTGNAFVTTLVNNGTIKTNGYTLTAATQSGTGTVTAIEAVTAGDASENATAYDLGGCPVSVKNGKGIYIQNGKKFFRK